MKIGIITINDNNNYGNRLQNYALQSYLKKMGADCNTLNNSPYTNTKDKYILRKIKKIFKGETYSKNKNRKNSFKNFNAYISFEKKNISVYSTDLDYDYYIVGSDQVWNPQIGRCREIDLLYFCDGMKRISYAASFGVSDISLKEKQNLKIELVKFKNISVREDVGKKIVEETTGRNDVEVLIDPTMLLTAEEWDQVSKKPKMLKKDRYILNYFLGNLSEDKKQEIERIAKENDCEIINILDKKSSFYECGPSEFLWLEKNAFLICTDSFHSSVFAILYNRPFIIFDRDQEGLISMNSRLETLISKFKLNGRKFEGKITNKNLEHNYTEAYAILKEERTKSKVFLEKALDIQFGDSNE